MNDESTDPDNSIHLATNEWVLIFHNTKEESASSADHPNAETPLCGFQFQMSFRECRSRVTSESSHLLVSRFSSIRF
jgi:hypothetical protein